MYFGYYKIPKNASHLIIDENTDPENLEKSLNKEFNEFSEYMRRYKNVKKIIEEQREEIKELENKILEKKHELEIETQNINQIAIIKNTIKIYEEDISIKTNWIKLVME
ncbi:hypothetical protein [Breznakiella homolactica]|uniref:Uncharacterized protein n=1 Tax=Breznakiella homolactica TaxID=2798577 RepID=A0A7T7XQ62_9SPIR|nr:hypothetical protein [Breznakiella homolactica]QQO10357.1 hypothetical protein JFL75_05410 [Breznakiella homolactica]